ncbi:MAG: D-alanyl-D-alanine carboxypeptidase family protein [Candidatus Dormibacteria bacterium]
MKAPAQSRPRFYREAGLQGRDRPDRLRPEEARPGFPRRARARARRRRISLLVVGGLLLLVGLGIPRALAHPGTALSGARASHLAVAPPTPPRPIPGFAYDETWLAANPSMTLPLSGDEAIIVDPASHRAVYALRPHQRHAIASLTKIVTAQVALDLASPDRVVTVPAAATQVEPDVMGLSAGERVSVRELLFGLLLDSGNDAAETLSQTLTTRDHFIALMNSRAVALGLRDTHFANPSGLDDPGQYSSAYDVSVLATYMLDHYPLLRQVVGTREEPIAATDGHKAFDPVNLDRLLWTYPGAFGVKPGYTGDAGYCLVAAAARDGATVLSVVLGSQRHFTDSQMLLDYGFQRERQG